MSVQVIPMLSVRGVIIPDLVQFYAYLLDTSAEIIERGDCIGDPLIFVLHNDGTLSIAPTFGDNDTLCAFQRNVVRDPAMRACAVISEAWVSTQKKGDPRIMPSEDPNRSEALIVSIMTAGRQATTFSRIDRPSNKVDKAPFEWLDEQKTYAEIGGRFIR